MWRWKRSIENDLYIFSPILLARRSAQREGGEILLILSKSLRPG